MRLAVMPCLFRSLEGAVRWCCALQLELLALDWPPALLAWPDCAAEVDTASGTLINRGLRVRAGVAFGAAQHRKPLNTGACGQGLDI